MEPQNLRDHSERWANCVLCRLGAGWTTSDGAKVVARRPKRNLGCPILYRGHVRPDKHWANDPTHRQLIFIGEAPGPSEDLLGAPFVGPSGKVLDCLIDDVQPRSYLITNAVACFPLDPNRLPERHFRVPDTQEIAACAPRLTELIALCRPKGLVLLGVIAKSAVSKFVKPATPMLALPHPSAIGTQDGYTLDWEWRRQNNVDYKRAKLALQQFLQEIG